MANFIRRGKGAVEYKELNLPKNKRLLVVRYTKDVLKCCHTQLSINNNAHETKFYELLSTLAIHGG
jgi:hypothetical protein